MYLTVWGTANILMLKCSGTPCKIIRFFCKNDIELYKNSDNRRGIHYLINHFLPEINSC